MKDISVTELAHVIGGNGPQVCTPFDNPNGLKPTRYWSNNPPTTQSPLPIRARTTA